MLQSYYLKEVLSLVVQAHFKLLSELVKLSDVLALQPEEGLSEEDHASVASAWALREGGVISQFSQLGFVKFKVIQLL